MQDAGDRQEEPRCYASPARLQNIPPSMVRGQGSVPPATEASNGIIKKGRLCTHLHRRKLPMNPDDLIALMRLQPFQPFSVHLNNGRTFEVRHPDQAMVVGEML